MASVSLRRNKGWFGRLRIAIIMADDVEIGRVKSGETVELHVPDGSINLYAKMDWGRSHPYPVCNIREGQTIYMNAWFTLNPLRNIGLIPIPITIEDQPR